MKRTRQTRWTLTLVPVLVTLGPWASAAAAPIWLDETGGGPGFASFDQLAEAYNAPAYRRCGRPSHRLRPTLDIHPCCLSRHSALFRETSRPTDLTRVL